MHQSHNDNTNHGVCSDHTKQDCRLWRVSEGERTWNRSIAELQHAISSNSIVSLDEPNHNGTLLRLHLVAQYQLQASPPDKNVNGQISRLHFDIIAAY
jgi:hypothetical protein